AFFQRGRDRPDMTRQTLATAHNEVGGQPLGCKGIQPPPPEPDGHVSVHPALQTQDLRGVTVRPGKPGPPAGGRRILLGGSYGGTPGGRALASGSGHFRSASSLSRAELLIRVTPFLLKHCVLSPFGSRLLRGLCRP